MAIKKDDKGKRWVEMEFIAPGTPEQIWQAMATGEGNATWFTRASIEERVGGELRFEFAPGVSSSGEVTAWEPPHRFGYVERNWNGEAPPVATEITITSRAGGRCVVRMVHSLFSATDDWDDQMEGFENGWPAFFEILKIYLECFAGMQGAAFMAMASATGDALATWTRLTTALGLAGANVGERRSTPAHPQRLSGVVERVHQDPRQRWVMLRLDEPVPGVASIGIYDSGKGINVSTSLYFYGADAAATAESSAQLWSTWLDAAFPSSGAVTG